MVNEIKQDEYWVTYIHKDARGSKRVRKFNKLFWLGVKQVVTNPTEIEFFKTSSDTFRVVKKVEPPKVVKVAKKVTEVIKKVKDKIIPKEQDGLDLTKKGLEKKSKGELRDLAIQFNVSRRGSSPTVIQRILRKHKEMLDSND